MLKDLKIYRWIVQNFLNFYKNKPLTIENELDLFISHKDSEMSADLTSKWESFLSGTARVLTLQL